jgi:hypothetical protein
MNRDGAEAKKLTKKESGLLLVLGWIKLRQ